jgi:hypothetical protein
MTEQLQRGQVSINIKRGLVATTRACIERLKHNGLSPVLADGVGDVLVSCIEESSVLPSEEISMTDLARAAGVLGRKRGKRV